MSITVPCTAIVAGWLRSDVPTVLISRPAIANSLQSLRKKKVTLDVEVKQSVNSWLQKLCTYLMQVRKQAFFWPRCDVLFRVTSHPTWRCVVYRRTSQSEASSHHEGVLN
jgi:hypothetical protein